MVLRLPVMVLLFALLAGAGCSRAGERAAAESRIRLVDCTLAGFSGLARCGTYLVWENRAARSGRQIALNLVVLPAVGDREADPVFYLDGGPGASAVAAAANVARLLAAAHQSRDLVFVDVRGTGRSGALRCPPVPDDAPLQRYFDDVLADEYVRECLAAQTADVRFYTHPIAMDDIEDVRAALGYDTINLFGASGGTRAAQVYMRRHGASVRSVVMHGVHPMDGEMPLPYSRAMEVTTRAVIDRCNADPACRERHPHLAAAWEHAKRLFDGGHVDASLVHPRTGTPERVRISRGVFAEGLRHLMYDLNAARDLPGVINAAALGDFGPFASRHMRRTRAIEETVARGMFLSTTCAEDVRFITEEDVRRETAGTFLGDYRVRRQQAACRIWPRGEGVDEDFQEPVRSAVPALLISGDADVATPAANGERVARALSKSRHVVFPGQGHNWADPVCGGRLIAEFLDTADPHRVDASCVAGRPRSDT